MRWALWFSVPTSVCRLVLMGHLIQHIVPLWRNNHNMVCHVAIYTEGVGDSSPSPPTIFIKHLAPTFRILRGGRRHNVPANRFFKEHDKNGTRPRWSVTRLQNGYDVVGSTLKKSSFSFSRRFTRPGRMRLDGPPRRHCHQILSAAPSKSSLRSLERI